MLQNSLGWLGICLDVSVKSALLALVAAAVLRVLRIGDANVRHRIWAGVLAGMIVLPFLSRVVPALQLPVPLGLDRLPALLTESPEEEPAEDIPLLAAASEPVETGAASIISARDVPGQPTDDSYRMKERARGIYGGDARMMGEAARAPAEEPVATNAVH